MVATADIAVAAQIIFLNSPGGTSVHLIGYMVPRPHTSLIRKRYLGLFIRFCWALASVPGRQTDIQITELATSVAIVRIWRCGDSVLLADYVRLQNRWQQNETLYLSCTHSDTDQFGLSLELN